jgi:transcription elongation factor Elf1
MNEKIRASRVSLEKITGWFRISGKFECPFCGESIKFQQKMDGGEKFGTMKKDCDECGRKYLIVSKVDSVAIEYNDK